MKANTPRLESSSTKGTIAATSQTMTNLTQVVVSSGAGMQPIVPLTNAVSGKPPVAASSTSD